MKDKIGGHNLPDFKTVWYWHKDKHTDRWNIEVVTHKYKLIGFQQISQSNLTGKGKSLQKNGAETTRHQCGEKIKLLSSHHTQKLIQNLPQNYM